MRKTGIYGGTFNPIHRGHLKIAKKAYEALELDRVLVIPSGCSYFKADQDIPDGRVRFEMCLLACNDFPFLEVSDIEIKREGNSYTCDTLKALKEDFPGDEFYYICGLDSLAQIGDFKDPGYIFSACTVAAALRDGFEENAPDAIIRDYEERFGARIRVFNTERIHISSSMVRKRAEEGLDISDLVPGAVEGYIQKNRLYRKDTDYQN